MKASRKEMQPAFIPYEITIKIESEKEATALYAMFNALVNSALFPPDSFEAIREAIGTEHRLASYMDHPMWNGITPHRYYDVTSRASGELR